MSAGAARVREPARSARRSLALDVLLHDVVVHDEAVADIGFHRVDGFEALEMCIRDRPEGASSYGA